MSRKSTVPLARYVRAGDKAFFAKKPRTDAYDVQVQKLVSDMGVVGVRRYDWGHGDFGFLINVENKYTVFLGNDGVTFVELGLVRGNGNDAHRTIEHARDVYAAQTAFMHIDGGLMAAEIGMLGRMKTVKTSMTNWVERQVSSLSDPFEAALTATAFRDILTAIASAEDAIVLDNLIEDLDRI